jgi:hypothetical protein
VYTLALLANIIYKTNAFWVLHYKCVIIIIADESSFGYFSLNILIIYSDKIKEEYTVLNSYFLFL